MNYDADVFPYRSNEGIRISPCAAPLRAPPQRALLPPAAARPPRPPGPPCVSALPPPSCTICAIHQNNATRLDAIEVCGDFGTPRPPRPPRPPCTAAPPPPSCVELHKLPSEAADCQVTGCQVRLALLLRLLFPVRYMCNYQARCLGHGGQYALESGRCHHHAGD